MAWRSIYPEDVRLAPVEQAALQNIQGSVEVCARLIGNVVGEFRDTLAAAGTPLGPETTVPDLVRQHAINRVRWLWLCEFPQLKTMQTEARSKANDAALQALGKIAEGKLRVPPGDGSDADQTVLPSIRPRRRHFRGCDEDGA